MGWDRVYQAALEAYICLNICYCFPSTWDSGSGRTAAKDYRNTRLYQSMLMRCTLSETTSEVSALPHRQFFGVADNQFRLYERPPCGIMSFAQLLTSDRAVPNKGGLGPFTVDYVSRILHKRGLPHELILMILGYVDRCPPSRMSVPHDPLHPENCHELRQYLTYCWQLIIRCNMMAQALGREMDWENEVAEILRWGLSSPGERTIFKYDSEWGKWII